MSFKITFFHAHEKFIKTMVNLFACVLNKFYFSILSKSGQKPVDRFTELNCSCFRIYNNSIHSQNRNNMINRQAERDLTEFY